MRSAFAGRVRVVNIAIVVQASVIPRVLVGVPVELDDVLRVAAVHVARSNLKVAEARRVDGGAARLGLVAEADRDVVGGTVADAGRCKVSKMIVSQRRNGDTEKDQGKTHGWYAYEGKPV